MRSVAVSAGNVMVETIFLVADASASDKEDNHA